MQFFTNIKRGWKLTYHSIHITLKNKKLLIYPILGLLSLILSGALAGIFLFFYERSFSNSYGPSTTETIVSLVSSNTLFPYFLDFIILSFLIYNFFYSSLVRSIAFIDTKPITIKKDIRLTLSAIPALAVLVVINTLILLANMLPFGLIIQLLQALVGIILLLSIVSVTLTTNNPLTAVAKAIKCIVKNIGSMIGVQIMVMVAAIANAVAFLLIGGFIALLLIKINKLIGIIMGVLTVCAFLMYSMVIFIAMTMSYTTIYIENEKKVNFD